MAPVTRSATSSPAKVTTSPSILRKASSKSSLRNGSDIKGVATTIKQENGYQIMEKSEIVPLLTSSNNSSPSKRKFRQFKSLFKPRPSPLDFETLWAEKHPLRGFFVLFWVSIAAKTIVLSYQYWRDTGKPVSLDFAYFMGKDSSELLVADTLMILSLFLVVIYQWLINWKIVPLSLARSGQHLWQAIWFLAIINWIYKKSSWAWTQTATFALHTIAMLMKQHSYTSYNIELQHRLRRFNHLIEIHKKNDVSLDQDEIDEMIDIEKELSLGGEPFPQNQTLWNFFDYLLVPSLVYEQSYPRTSRFRLWYFFERVFSTICVMGVLYFIVEHQINPIFLKMPTQTFMDSVFDLLLPFMTCWILIFFLIFECICNAFAEITCFADREFYSDWWNSTNFEEFARLWNKPVHLFLLRHCYKESIQNLALSKTDATFLTFFLSSLMHELVFVVLVKRIRLYLFFLQMFQLPLIVLGRMDRFKRMPIAGNAFFWFGIYLGPPFLAVCYCRDYFLQ